MTSIVVYPGAITGFTIFWTIMLFIFVAVSVGLTVYSCKKKYWTGNKGSNWKFVTATAISFLIGSFIAFVNYIFILNYGWSEGNISEYIFWLFTTAYTVSLFMAIYLWIKRLEAVFSDSAFQISNNILKTLKVIYFAIVILGFITLILFFAIENSIILWTLSGLWTLLFAIELSVLQVLFIHKLVKLRTMAEATLKSVQDEKQLKMVQKVWFLQTKLTVLATTTIVSTVVALIVSFNVDFYYDLVPFGVDSFIGFICIYCALAKHKHIYSQICIVCIKCCDVCCRKDIIDNELQTQIEIQSQTGATYEVTVEPQSSKGDQSKTNKSNSGGSSNEKHGYQYSTDVTTTKAASEAVNQSAHVPAPSGTVTHNYVTSQDESTILKSQEQISSLEVIEDTP